MLKGNALIGQSGGPTSVINSSLAGVIETVISSSFIDNIYGMHFGIEGFMQEWLYNLGKQPRKIIEGLRHTPSSALGSSRHKVQDSDLPHILDLLKKYNIRYFFLIIKQYFFSDYFRNEKSFTFIGQLIFGKIWRSIGQ